MSGADREGEIVLFDRSWYNRAGVERVMGFAEPRQYMEFMREAPELERMFVRSGIHLVKLSPMDLASLDKWGEYTEAKEAMFFYTDTADAPWTVIKSNDKKRARVEAMRHVLYLFDYPGKDLDIATPPDPQIVGPASLVFEEGEQPAHFPPLGTPRSTAATLL